MFIATDSLKDCFFFIFFFILKHEFEQESHTQILNKQTTTPKKGGKEKKGKKNPNNRNMQDEVKSFHTFIKKNHMFSCSEGHTLHNCCTLLNHDTKKKQSHKLILSCVFYLLDKHLLNRFSKHTLIRCCILTYFTNTEYRSDYPSFKLLQGWDFILEVLIKEK